MSKRKSGWLAIHRKNWSAGPAHTPEPAIMPTAWDKLLREMQLTESQALELLADRR